MRKIKRREVQEIRVIDRKLPNGNVQSDCYVKARGMWFRDTRFPDSMGGDYTEKSLIDDFIFLQEFFERVDDPGTSGARRR